jgi:hypothetical protein
MENSILAFDEFSFSVYITMLRQNADISDFEENEIRVLSPRLNDDGKWSGFLNQKPPRQLDLGIDSDRNLYWYHNNEWEKT